MLAGAAATTVMAGPTAVTAATTHHGLSFRTVLDAVEDLGMDPTGNEPIDDALDGAIADDTLIEFPPGEYLFARDRTYHDLSNFGMRGTGSSMQDVVIRPPRGEGYEFFRCEHGTGILIENLTLDQRDTIPEWNTLVIDVDDRAELHDIEFAGFHPSEDPPEQPTTKQSQNPLRFHQHNRDGVSNITGIVKRGPSDMPPYPEGTSCLYFGTDVHGEVNVRNCYIANMSSHAMYASQSPGTFRFEGCTFKNNNGIQCRVSGDDAVVRDCTIIIDVDNAHPDNIYPDGSPKYNSLGVGIWTVSQTDPPQAGGLVEDTDVICRSVPDLDGTRPWLIECDGSAGPTTYRNVRIHVESDDHAIVKALDTTRVRLPAGFPDDQSVTFDGVTITGTSAGRRPAIDVQGRDVTIENSCLDLAGDRDGIGIQAGAFNRPEGTIADTNINVDGTATVIEDASVTTSNLTYQDTCQVQDSTNSYDHTLRVMADDGADAFEYQIVTSGPAELDTTGEYAATPEVDGRGEAVTENDDGTYTVTGIVADGGGDSFYFDGEVLAADLGGSGTVYVDGTALDLDTIPSSRDPMNSYDHALRVMADDGADAFEYQVRTSGAAELDTTGEYAATPEVDGQGEAVTENDDGTYTVAGIVADGGGDSFHFDGEVLAADLGGSGALYVDGIPLDLTGLRLANTLTIVGAGTEHTRYEAAVDGDIAADLEADDFNAGDTVSDGVVSGAVKGGTDSYVFSGTITSVTLDGTAAVFINGTQVDPALLGTGQDPALRNLLQIDGLDSASDYAFEVTGSVAVSPDVASVETSDVVSGSAVDGVVEGDVDAYRFSGDVEQFVLDGAANITFETGA